MSFSSLPFSNARRRFVVAAVAAAAGLVAGGVAQAGPGQEPAGAPTSWVGTWSTGVAEPENGVALAGFTDTTFRQRIHVSIGGDVARLRLTNVYGEAPLEVGSVTIALPSDDPDAEPGDVDDASLTEVTFAGSTTVRIPAGAEIASDPIEIDVPDDGDVIASLYVPGPTGPATYHALAQATGWIAGGDRTADTGFEDAEETGSFWFLDGLDVHSTIRGSVVVLGDSITDGDGSTKNADHRWPDYLADRMLDDAPAHRFGILNAGMSGNRLLLDARWPGMGDSALARLEREALTQTGVSTLFVFLGVNDLQWDPTEYDPEQLIAAYKQIILRAHDRGLSVVGATITPFRGWSRWSPEREVVRVAVNEWIRTSGEFDSVVDFDEVLRDPDQPDTMLPAYDSGDHLHPGDAGYEAMAEAVDLKLLRP